MNRSLTTLTALTAILFLIAPGFSQQAPEFSRMVEITAKIFEFRYDTETQFGVFYQFNSNDSTLQDSDVFLHGTENVATDAPIPALDLSGSFAKLSYGSIDFNVKAALQEGWGTIISNPTLMTADGVPASIHNGEQIPYTTVKITGTRSKLQLQEKPTGIKLVVTPHILPNDNVFMNLEVESNDAVRFEVFDRGEGERYELPVVSRRNVQTAVIIPSGQRLYIGGLYSRTTGDITRKIPIVGDLPVLGFFLRGFNKQRGTSETMFQITPTIRQPGIGIQTQLSGFDQVLGPENTVQSLSAPGVRPDPNSLGTPPQPDRQPPKGLVPEIPEELKNSKPDEEPRKERQTSIEVNKEEKHEGLESKSRRTGKAHLKKN